MMLTKRTSILLGAGTLLLALTVAGAAVLSRGTPVTVPEGTALQVRLDQALASNQNRAGDVFSATVADPVKLDGKMVIPQGARVQGRVVSARESGRLSGVAHLTLTLDSVAVGGKSYDVRTTMTGRRGRDHFNRNLEWIGGGGAGGALIGAIAGGGKGALIGGPIGAGAGTAVAALTGKKDFRLPAEALLTFRLTEPVTIRVKT